MEISSSPSLASLAWEQMLQNPRKALELSLEAYESAAAQNDPAAVLEGLYNLGWCYFYLSQQPEALNCFNNALDKSLESKNPVWELKTRIGLGAVYQELSRFEVALDHLTIALRLSQEQKDPACEVQANLSIGKAHLAFGKPHEALGYFQKALAMADEQHEEESLAEISLSLGQTYLVLKDNDLALDQLARALMLTKRLKNRIGEGRALTLIGLIYRDINELEISEDHHMESLKIFQSVDHKWGQLDAYCNLGDLHLLRGHREVALKYYEKVLALSAELDSKVYASKAYDKLAGYWEKSGNPQKALEYARQAYSLERDLKADETTQKVHSLHAQYEFEKSKAQSEILRLNSERLEQESLELKKALDSLRVISELGRRITSTLKGSQLTQILYDSLSQLFSVPTFGLALFENKEKSFHYAYRIENGKRVAPGHRRDALTTPGGWSMLHKTPVLIQDLEKEAGKFMPEEAVPEYLSKATFRSAIFIPLYGEREIVGAIAVQNPEPDAYSDLQVRFLETLSGYVTVALNNVLNHQKMDRLNRALRAEKRELESANKKIQHMAHHDLLTGLANRRLFTDFVSKTIPYSQRHNHGFALFFLDLDGFKPVNDSLGHDTGDWVLSQLGNRLSLVLRDSDMVARIGGDEFAAMALEIADQAQALVVAEKIIKAISEPLLWQDKEILLGVSIGISLFPQDGSDVETLLNRADNAMYRVKHTTKNGVAFHEGSPT